ncbi:MAG: efflux RND transporter periplasmic adaptor subunit [Deltaproteobacteria bacterium]|nr:efflux RND transporter periplasmic adaptor subunit [Deltaproteobacteria bacterium]
MDSNHQAYIKNTIPSTDLDDVTKKKSIVRIALLILLFALPTVLGACSKNEAEARGTAAAKELEKTPVEVFRADKRVFKQTVEYPATVAANKRATLVAKIPGEIIKVLVVEGDRVKDGQRLIEFDPVDIRIALRQAQAQEAAAQAGLEMADANLKNIEKNYNRMSVLHEKKTIAGKEFDQIDAGYKAALAQVKVAQAQLLVAEAAVNAARTNLGDMTVRAPFDGVIVSRMVDEGARTSAAPPTPLVTIVDTKAVKLVGGIPERAILAVRAGAAAQVYVDAVSPEPIAAKVERIEPIVDPKTRTATARVVVNNTDGKLMDGMSARVVIEASGYEAPAVPDDAILRNELESTKGTVFVVDGNKAYRREIVLGSRDGDLVEVVSGLSGGEMVIRSSQAQFTDGQVVQIKKGREG